MQALKPSVRLLAGTFCSGQRCFLSALSSTDGTRRRPDGRPVSMPPRETLEPYADLSDVVEGNPRNLAPSPWLARIVALLDGSPEMEHHLDEFCRNFLIRLSPEFVSHVLRNPRVQSSSAIALRFFDWARNQRNFSPDLNAFVSLIDSLSRSGNVDLVRAFAEEMMPAVSAIGAKHANSLLKNFAAAGLVKELLWLWRKMKENNIEIDLLSYNCLMDGLVNAGFYESAARVFDSIIGGGRMSPDVVSYNIIIKGFCRWGKTQEAAAQLKEMEEKGIVPDKITYLTLIQSFYSVGEFDSCLGLYHEMQEKGVEIPPHAYTLVITSLCKNGKPHEALRVFDSMALKNCAANVAIYTALIDGFAKMGNESKAVTFFNRMKAEGFEPDAVVFSVMVNLLCKVGKVDEALEWYENCKESGVAINSVFFTSLIDGLGKAGRINEADRVFGEMGIIGCARDSYCYNAMMDGFVKAGKVERAIALFKEMEKEGCEQTVYSFTIMIDGLFKEHRNEEALKVWEQMIDKGITPNAACFRALSLGLCMAGKVSRACKILDDLAPMGILPDGAYADMIGVLCRVGRVDHACKLADGIVDREREIPGKVRTVLLNALRKAGNADLAVKLLHSKIGIGYDRMGSVKRRVKFQNLLRG
ncbi:pentatricopeptide repeat-containing protein At1g03560, mitochondrial [Nymphaea colorata]|nr:pentatricopeptide repeat-containing protein At1g03560, mitochondrial [Nymphaea colorata]